MTTRSLGKAGTWYAEDKGQLSRQLEDYLREVGPKINDSSLPIPGARIVIAP